VKLERTGEHEGATCDADVNVDTTRSNVVTAADNDDDDDGGGGGDEQGASSYWTSNECLTSSSYYSCNTDKKPPVKYFNCIFLRTCTDRTSGLLHIMESNTMIFAVSKA